MVDSNPYSRLMALQRMGIVENYERIREFSVAIVVSYYLPPFFIFLSFVFNSSWNVNKKDFTCAFVSIKPLFAIL